MSGTDIYICPGCRVVMPWEHRCWEDRDEQGREGRPCECKLCEWSEEDMADTVAHNVAAGILRPTHPEPKE